MLARGDANQGPARSWWHLGCAGTVVPWGGAEVWCAGATSLAPCLQVHGQKAAWEDPVEWVRDTLPWPSAQQDQSKLYHLPPPTIGPHSTVSPPEERTVKDTTPSSLDADPLVWPWCAGCWEGEGWCWWGESSMELSIAFPVSFWCKNTEWVMQKRWVFLGGCTKASSRWEMVCNVSRLCFTL